MSKRIRSRCGKRPVNLTAPKRLEDGKFIPASKAVLGADGALYRIITVNGKQTKVHVLDIDERSRHFGTERIVHENSQGESVAPTTRLTVFVRRSRKALRRFCRKWILKGFRIKQCIKDGAPLVDPRGVAFSVNGGNQALIAEMLRDEYLAGYHQSVAPRCALGSGEFARKPRDKSGAVRRHVTTRIISGQKVYVRI